ncbi:MAG: LysR family transcriptional regulator [Myxococcales bacterium]|nr:LysR family transcriptional regulator [Myxococcales bacterium]
MSHFVHPTATPWERDVLADFDLDLLRALVAIADGGTLSAAARALGASRTTMRRRLIEVEARAGVSLMVRRGDHLLPTEAGRLLLRGARSLLAQATALMDQAAAVGTEPQGLIRVALTAGEPPFLAGLALQGVGRRWPQVQLELINAATPQRLLTEHADAALVFAQSPPDGPWEAVHLMDFNLLLAASPAYLAQHGAPQRVEDLAAHRVLAWRSDLGGTEPLRRRDGALVDFPAPPLLVSNNVYTLRTLTVAGQCIGHFPDAGFRQPGEGPEPLRAVLADQVGGTIPFWLLLPDAYREIPRLRALADAMVTVIRGLRATQPLAGGAPAEGLPGIG